MANVTLKNLWNQNMTAFDATTVGSLTKGNNHQVTNVKLKNGTGFIVLGDMATVKAAIIAAGGTLAANVAAAVSSGKGKDTPAKVADGTTVKGFRDEYVLFA